MQGRKSNKEEKKSKRNSPFNQTSPSKDGGFSPYSIRRRSISSPSIEHEKLKLNSLNSPEPLSLDEDEKITIEFIRNKMTVPVLIKRLNACKEKDKEAIQNVIWALQNIIINKPTFFNTVHLAEMSLLINALAEFRERFIDEYEKFSSNRFFLMFKQNLIAGLKQCNFENIEDMNVILENLAKAGFSETVRESLREHFSKKLQAPSDEMQEIDISDNKEIKEKISSPFKDNHDTPRRRAGTFSFLSFLSRD